MDEMIGIVRVLRQKFPIQDRLMKMEVKNSFSGSERKKKTQRGRKLRGKKKTEVVEIKEEREVEKEKGGEIK
jgi:hypothetical protein